MPMSSVHKTRPKTSRKRHHAQDITPMADTPTNDGIAAMNATTRALAAVTAIAMASACSLMAAAPARAQRQQGEGANAPQKLECLAPRPDWQEPASPDKLRARTSFALSLLAGSSQDAASPLVQVSPFGAAQVLLALDYGADAEMRKAIAKVLGAGPKQGLEAMRADARVLNVLAREKAARLATADALFLDQSLKIKPGLAERVQGETATQVRTVEFGDPAAVDAVNDWAREATGGRIASILEPGEKLSLAAINAFAFADCWKHPFDPARTAPIQFRRADGQEEATPAMTSAQLQLPFANQGDWFAVELPYADERFAMTLVTNTRSPLTQKTLKDALAIAAAPMEPTSIVLQLPKFRASAGADLLGAMSRLGLGDHRRLPGFGADVALSAVRQKTMLIVDEQGTQAAAVTAGVATRSAPMPPVRLSFAQPFAFLLRHKPTGVVLLAGLYQRPEGAGEGKERQ